jgi:hypothetical protein
MSNITRLPPLTDTIHVEADIPRTRRDEFEQAMREILAGQRARRALERIEQAIVEHSAPGALPRRLLQRLGLPVRPRGAAAAR